MDYFQYSIACFYMNVDKWTRCDQFLLINRPSVVIVLYWGSDGLSYCILYKLSFG